MAAEAFASTSSSPSTLLAAFNSTRYFLFFVSTIKSGLYTPTDTSYISFKKRWERFEKFLTNNGNKLPNNKMVHLYKRVRNRLLHGM
jgi:hypothetical protein